MPQIVRNRYNRNMDAILLAAGLGTRLRPHTENTPKPLLLVQRRPILDWILGALPTRVDRIIVVTHYLGEQIEQYLATQTRFRDWTVVPQGNPRGTGDALRRCQSAVKSDTFLCLNGDDLFGAADLAQLAAHPAGVIVHPVDDPKRFGIAFLKEDGTLEKLVEKPDLPGPRLANTGAYVFPRSVFDLQIQLSPRNEYEITDYVSQVAARQAFHVVQASFWFPIGTVEAWNQAQRLDLQSVLTASR